MEQRIVQILEGKLAEKELQLIQKNNIIESLVCKQDKIECMYNKIYFIESMLLEISRVVGITVNNPNDPVAALPEEPINTPEVVDAGYASPADVTLPQTSEPY